MMVCGQVCIVRVSDASGQVLEPVWLAAAEAVHRELRPQLPADYALAMQGVFDDGGEMAVASCDGQLVAVCVFRVFRNTVAGRLLYVDDLVTRADLRSAGVGSQFMAWLEGEALRRGAMSLQLDSGTQRGAAHRFYHRHGMTIGSFRFNKNPGAGPKR